MTTVAWPESWLYGNEVQGLQALLCMCVTLPLPSLPLSICVCVSDTVGLKVAVPIVSQWSRAGLTASSYFHLQTAVFTSIYVYMCVFAHTERETETHQEKEKETATETETCKWRHCALSSLKV